jgi:prepilin-type N-terminal cleavage/methylation domain-containing protein
MPVYDSHEAAMSRPCASPASGNSRGFTLIEMLVAVAITLLIGGAIAGAVPPARAAFDRVPAELEMQQRGRAAVALLSEELRAAARVALARPEGSGNFSELTVVVPAVNGSQGVLLVDQAAPGAAMTLAVAPCPSLADVCGFVAGAAAMIANPDGAFDVFIVSSANPATRQLTPDRMLSRAYAAGSTLTEVEEHTYGLDAQADGSYSLARVTAAGAVQPVIDFVSRVAFGLEGNRARVEVTIHAPTALLRQAVAARTFKTSIAVRNAS